MLPYLPKKFTLVAIFLLCQVVSVHAQTVEQSVKLQQLSTELKETFERERNSAIHIADSLGLPIRKTFNNGQTVALIKFEAGRPIYKITHNAEGASLNKTDDVFNGGSAGLSLTGNNQVIGLWDAGHPRTDHQELNGRIQPINTSSIDAHTTHIAGTLIATGIDTDAKGMAPQATIDSYDFLTDQPDMALASGNGLLLSTHPYGYSVGWAYGTFNNENTAWYWFGSASSSEDYSFGLYDNDNARAWDEIAYNAPNYLIVTSAGNDRGRSPEPEDEKYEWDGSSWVACTPTCTTEHEINGNTYGFDTLSDNSVAKNVLVVGAIDGSKNMWTHSNWGPTDDGRIKPDIVAKGVDIYSTTSNTSTSYGERTGTSSSTPVIAGSAALLMEHQENLHSSKTLQSSTLRGLIIHTAEDLGRPGPDYEYGWGLMNTRKAADVMSDNATNNKIHIRELSITDGQVLEFTIKAKGNEALRASISWTDPPGSPVDPIVLNPTDLMLVNDLDMRLSDSNNSIHYPYTLNPANPTNSSISSSDNFRDNIELIHIENPTPGELYTVTISHKGSSLENGQQSFSMIVTGNEAVSYQQQIAEGNGEGWRFISAPTETATYSELLANIWTQGPANADDEIALESESNVLLYGQTGYESLSDLHSTIPTGSGAAVFIYDDDKDKTLSTSGIEHIGDVSVSHLLEPGSIEDHTFTLLGNPFFSTIDFDEFTMNSSVGNVVYVYDHSCNSIALPDESGGTEGGCFRAWNGSVGSLSNGLIAPFQGFFVYSTDSNPLLTIPEQAKSTGGSFYKEQQQQLPIIQLAVRVNEQFSGETWLSFSESGSVTKNRYDAPYLYPMDYKPFVSIQSHFDDTGYHIKHVSTDIEEPLQIPLIIESWEPDNNESSPGYLPMNGIVEILWPKLENIPENWVITLSDHHLGTVTDMKTKTKYTYSTATAQKQSAPEMTFNPGLHLAKQSNLSENRFSITVTPRPYTADNKTLVPEQIELHQNYPNPFNPVTVISYTLSQTDLVSLDVYSINGTKVASLVHETQQAGTYSIPFNADRFSSGVYIYTLTAGNRSINKKMILVK